MFLCFSLSPRWQDALLQTCTRTFTLVLILIVVSSWAEWTNSRIRIQVADVHCSKQTFVHERDHMERSVLSLQLKNNQMFQIEQQRKTSTNRCRCRLYVCPRLSGGICRNGTGLWCPVGYLRTAALKYQETRTRALTKAYRCNFTCVWKWVTANKNVCTWKKKNKQERFMQCLTTCDSSISKCISHAQTKLLTESECFLVKSCSLVSVHVRPKSSHSYTRSVMPPQR